MAFFLNKGLWTLDSGFFRKAVSPAGVRSGDVDGWQGGQGS